VKERALRVFNIIKSTLLMKKEEMQTLILEFEDVSRLPFTLYTLCFAAATSSDGRDI
jgi:hypothetical protein